MEHKDEDFVHIPRIVGFGGEWLFEEGVTTDALRDCQKKVAKALFSFDSLWMKQSSLVLLQQPI